MIIPLTACHGEKVTEISCQPSWGYAMLFPVSQLVSRPRHNNHLMDERVILPPETAVSDLSGCDVRVAFFL